MKYSVIIPTMYFHVEQLTQMLAVYNSMNCVGEILIINNCKENAVDFPFDKVRVIGDGVNMYVNPAWSFGVEHAKYENVVIANDDITINGDVNKVFELVLGFLKEGIVVGPSSCCFSEFQGNTTDIKLKNQVINKRKITYGFGVLMFVKKRTFVKTYIPTDFLIWYGDHILCLRNESWEFSGVEIITSMRGTTSRIDLKNFAIKERRAFRQLQK